MIYIDSELESLLGFDRPVNWGEHATIGGPFLEQGKTVTEMSASRAMTRYYPSEAVDPPVRHNLADVEAVHVAHGSDHGRQRRSMSASRPRSRRSWTTRRR